MKSTMVNLWHPVRGVQIRDLGEKGGSSSFGRRNESSLLDHALNAMDQDLEDVALVGEERKKLIGELDDLTGKEEMGNTLARNRRMVVLNHLSSVATKCRADWA
ncbi:hypothetical protein J1N35_013795 [Gossypium stocksii]|uniref:Uncharacterized protein n=1 Tax=Gossypium stocksii TaxID=47602 RepID=A0A9D4A8Q0_9ROSI|nr:hypothetical protein J1N35_013795 [Gossypium stocksii]